MIKRNEVQKEDFTNTRYVVCGCGVDGCGFITKIPKSTFGGPDRFRQNEIAETATGKAILPKSGKISKRQ